MRTNFPKENGDSRTAPEDSLRKVSFPKGSQAYALSPGQVADALAAKQRLQNFYQATSHEVSLLGAVAEFCEAALKGMDEA